MSTPAVTPTPVTANSAAPVATTVASPSAITTAETWLQKHEKIIIVFLVLVSATWLGNKWLDISANHAKAKAEVTTQTLNTQTATDKVVASQAQQLAVQYRTLAAKLSAQNAKLAANISKRDAAVVKQQVDDQTMPVTDLATHWASLAGFDPSEIVTGPTTVSVTDAAARQTVEQLEKVPEMTANLKDETAVADNRQQEIDKADLLVGGLNSQVSALNLTVTDTQKACKADTALLKADARKKSRNWFVRGLIVGGGVALAIVFHI